MTRTYAGYIDPYRRNKKPVKCVVCGKPATRTLVTIDNKGQVITNRVCDPHHDLFEVPEEVPDVR